jgi:CPA2 family monovalent cation:H+ antiporter-2
MVVSGTDSTHETLAQLLPFRNALAALFFVTIGALMNPSGLLSHPAHLAAIVAMVVLGKFVIWTAVVWLFRYPVRGAGCRRPDTDRRVLLRARSGRRVRPRSSTW